VSAEGRLRLTIVGGFLGSGKTTWLRHQLFAGRFPGAHVIVNEAAGTPVDHGLLEGAAAQTVLAGGCACCDGADAFREALLSICDARSQSANPKRRIGQLVLETSGLADPAAIVDLIQSNPVLVRHIVVHDVIVVVDALFGQAALVSEPVAQAQIRAADRLILTKTDITPAETVARLRRMLHALSPGATQSGAVFGSDAALTGMALEAEEHALPELSLTGRTITTCQLHLGPEPDWTALTLWLSALLHVHGDQIVRVKGIVSAPSGRLLVQAVRNRVQAPEVLPPLDGPEPTDNTLVLIGSDLSPEDVTQSFWRVLQAG
jgi:G3E family GTPase